MDHTTIQRWTRAFPLGPDDIALFPGTAHALVLRSLRHDLQRGTRLLCLTGPAGVGKSMVLRKLRAELADACVAELPQPSLGALLPRLADSLGLAAGTEAAMQAQLRTFVDTLTQRRQSLILIVDDAETLASADLAALRRLFAPLPAQLVLAGQPGLMRQFTDGAPQRGPDRVYQLAPLSRAEVGDYIRHRLDAAGLDPEWIRADAVAAIDDYCGGLPRLINLLCFGALAQREFNLERPLDAAGIHEAARARLESGSYPFPRTPPALEAQRRAAQEVPAPASTVSAAAVSHANSAGIPAAVATASTPAAAAVLSYGAPSRPPQAAHTDAVPTRARGGGRRVASDFSARALPELAAPASGRRVARRPPAVRAALWAGLAVTAVLVLQTQWHAPEPAAGFASSPAPTAVASATNAGAVAEDGAAGVDDTSTRDADTMDTNAAAAVNADTTGTIDRSGGTMAAPVAAGAGAIAPLQAAAAGAVSRADAELFVDDAVRDAADEAALAEPVAAKKPAAAEPGGAAALSAAQRSHLARLYAERAEYEREAGRLRDARVSVRYGLEVAPENARLRELDDAIEAALTSSADEVAGTPSL